MASSVGFRSNVPPLEPENFNGWVRLFRAYLMRFEILNETLDDSSSEEIEDEIPEDKLKRIKKRNHLKQVNKQKVYSYLMEAAAADTTAKSIATSSAMEIGAPKILMKALEARFAVKRALTYQQSLKSFHNMTASSEESGAQFVDRLKAKVSELCYFKDEAPPTDSTILAIVTEGIRLKFPILYNNLIVSAINLSDAFELILNYTSVSVSASGVSVVDKKLLSGGSDEKAVAHFIAENKKLKKKIRRFNKLDKKRKQGSLKSDADIECFKCGQKGHKKFECPQSKKTKVLREAIKMSLKLIMTIMLMLFSKVKHRLQVSQLT